VLEQGLDSVTGALARPPAPASSSASAPKEQAALMPPADADPIGPFKPVEAKAEPAAPLPKIAPVATVAPAAPVASTATPAKRDEQKAETPAANPSPAPEVTAALVTPDTAAGDTLSSNLVRRTEFGVDLGGANSVEGLRAVWRGALKTGAQQLASLQPIIVVKERNDGLGMQLRLVAGPLSDAAEAAKLCAGLLTERNRPCETSVYEGQRLSLTSASEKTHEAPVHRSKRRSRVRAEVVEEKPRTSSFSSFFGMK
jgi:hypothetical protein